MLDVLGALRTPPRQSSSSGAVRLGAIFFVDESGALADASTVVRAEIARELMKLDAHQTARVVVFRPGRPLLDVPAEMLDDALSSLPNEQKPDTDAPPAGSLQDALTAAAAAQPEQLFILSDRLGGGGDFDNLSLRQAVADANANGHVRVNAIHFFVPEGRATMRAIARENAGVYSFVSR